MALRGFADLLDQGALLSGPAPVHERDVYLPGYRRYADRFAFTMPGDVCQRMYGHFRVFLGQHRQPQLRLMAFSFSLIVFQRWSPGSILEPLVALCRFWLPNPIHSPYRPSAALVARRCRH